MRSAQQPHRRRNRNTHSRIRVAPVQGGNSVVVSEELNFQEEKTGTSHEAGIVWL